MKIGIVAFNRSWRFMGGGVTCIDTCKDILISKGFDAEIIAINGTGCPLDYPGYDVAYDFKMLEWKKDLVHSYDRLIIGNYTSLGRTDQHGWYMNHICDFLGNLIPEKYLLILHDEYDIMGPFLSKLIQQGILDRWLFNSESVRKHLGEFFGITGGYFNLITPKRIDFKLEDKTSDFHYIGRLVDNQKFVINLLTICSSLGRGLVIYGPLYKPLLQTLTTLPLAVRTLWETSYKGPCEEPTPAIQVRQPFKFSWGVVRGYKERLQKLTTFDGEFMPRLEQSVLESIRAGSLPILVKSTIPE